MLTKKLKLSYKNRRQLQSFLLIIPWIVGFCMFFFIPLVKTFILSFVKEYDNLEFVGFDNYKYLFGKDFVYIVNNNNYGFSRIVWESIKKILIELPIITIFSLIIALLLNREFKGRGFARTIFFLPVIFGSTLVARLNNQNQTIQYFTHVIEGQDLYKSFNVSNLFYKSNIPTGVTTTLVGLVSQVFEIVSFSGVQMLIFLSAIQSINPTLYEVAEIEGATKYECFWKITIPSILPAIITSVVYTFVDILYRSPMTYVISDVTSKQGFAKASAISVIFLVITMLLLTIIVVILRRLRRGQE